MKTVQELTSKCVQGLNQCKQVHFLWHYTNLCCSNTVWSLCGVLYCLLNIARLACFVRILYIQFNDVWKNPKKQPGKPSLVKLLWSAFYFSPTYLHILKIQLSNHLISYFTCAKSFFISLLLLLFLLLFPPEQIPNLPAAPETRCLRQERTPAPPAHHLRCWDQPQPHSRCWWTRGVLARAGGRTGWGRGGQLSHFGMGCKRPGTVSYLQLLGAVFRPLPGLCFQLYHCFWRKSLLEKEKEKERSNWDSSCLCCLLQFKI